MSSGMDSALQLSDIMAAFDIPDAGDLPHQCPPPAPPALENLVPAQPTTAVPVTLALETPIPNMDVQASTLLASIASVASSASFKEQSSGRLSTAIEQDPQFGGSVSSMAYDMKTSMELRHQHEAAMEFDQLQEHSQPVLVYSKEDWPSPDPHLQTNSDPDTVNVAPQHPESLETAPSSSKGIYHAPTTGISHGARRLRSGSLRALPQSAQRQVREGSNQQKVKRCRGKKQDEPTLQSDSFKPFRSVMTTEHRNLISKGLSDSEMIELLAELQELLRAKHRDSKRLRRASLTHEQLQEERRRNRERKRRSRQDPFIEFRHIMTEEQRKLLLQPDLDPARRDSIMTELMAVRKWINREQKRARRAQMTEEQRAEERRKSREYKRRARSNPLQAFKSVITARHCELLNQDLDQEQRENLVQELIELRKGKQRDDMRKRRANFSLEQRERERSYSREYQRMQHQRTASLYEWGPNAVGNIETVNERMQTMPYPALLVGDSTAHVNEKTKSVQDPRLPVGGPGPTARLVKGSVSFESTNMPIESGDLLKEDATSSKAEQEKFRNKIRQRRRRAMQTEEEKAEERRKNRERSRMRRKRLAEIEKVVARGKSQTRDSLSNLAMDTGCQGSTERNHWKDVSIKTETDSPHEQVTGTPNISCSSADQTCSSPQSKLLPDQTASWFTKQLMDQIRKRNRECTQRARANMTEEQRERERERNRERQRLRRLMQTPEERAAYIEKQRNIRRLQRQEPAYREKERERQRLRKKKLRESPWYRAHENTLYHLRKARKSSSPKMYMPLEDNKPQEEMGNDASQQQDCGSTNSEDLIASDEYDEMEKEINKSVSENGEEGSLEESSINDEDMNGKEEESDSDFEIMCQRSIEDTEQDTREKLDKEPREDKDLRVKISTSLFGLHKIVPLNH